MIKAVQISAKRSGSTFLMNCLDSHPQIEALEELFVSNPKHPPSQKYIQEAKILPYQNWRRMNSNMPISSYLKKIWSKFNKDIVIFKLMYNQINGELQRIINNFHIIHLKRKNLLRQVISNENAQFTDFYILRNLTPQVIIERIKNLEKGQEKWTRTLNKCSKYMEIFYEDIIGEKEAKITWMNPKERQRICNFFNIKEENIYSYTKKKNKRPIFDYLPDPEGTKRVLKDTKYEWMLED